MARNIHKVQNKQWKKWKGMGQAMFNRLWECTSLVGPDAQAYRWNSCFMAASIANDLQDELKWNKAIRKEALKGVEI